MFSDPRLSPCSHEEADTRFFVHVNDCAKTGHSKIVVRTSDTDVIVIAVANFHLFPTQTKLFEKFGKINTCRSVST